MIDNRTRIVIAQHPREEFHSLNTARIVERALLNGERIVTPVGHLNEVLHARLSMSGTALLYPSADAELLEDIQPSAYPERVLVLDGTWHHTKTLLRDVPYLSALRKIRFIPSQASRYTIRKEPRREYLSTLEAVHHLLRHIEPDTPDLDRLLTVFEQMISANQAARRREGRNVRFLGRSKQRAHRFPWQLSVDTERFVSCYAEGTLQHAELEKKKAEPFWFGLERPFSLDQSLVQRVIKTTICPKPRLLSHLEVSHHDWQNGCTSGDARRVIEAALRPGDVLCVWNTSTVGLLRELGVAFDQILVLKGVYCDYQRYSHFAHASGASRKEAPHTFGDLEDVVRRHHLVGPRTVSGRGLARLRQTSAMLEWLRLQARS